MIKWVSVTGLIFIGFATIAFMVVGSHGHLMFRPGMMEDWIYWGIVVTSFLSAIAIIMWPRKRVTGRSKQGRTEGV